MKNTKFYLIATAVLIIVLIALAVADSVTSAPTQTRSDGATNQDDSSLRGIKIN